MPNFDIPKTYKDGDDLYESDLDAAFEYLETALNTTKLDSSNIQSAGVSSDNLASASVTEQKLAASAVTLAKVAADLSARLVPTGSVNAFAGSAAPTGWLFCDGSAISRTLNAALFAVIGSTHGQGDGATTFNLPDYRGRFLRGTTFSGPATESRSAMATGGSTSGVGSVQANAFGSHDHGGGSHTHGYGVPNFQVALNNGAGGDVLTYHSNQRDSSTTTSPNSTVIPPQGASETRPDNAFVNYIIKA